MYGQFVPWSFRSNNKELFRSVIGEKQESIEQISSSERNNFLYLELGMTIERNDLLKKLGIDLVDKGRISTVRR